MTDKYVEELRKLGAAKDKRNSAASAKEQAQRDTDMERRKAFSHAMDNIIVPALKEIGEVLASTCAIDGRILGDHRGTDEIKFELVERGQRAAADGYPSVIFRGAEEGITVHENSTSGQSGWAGVIRWDAITKDAIKERVMSVARVLLS
jgi:hypothetical protein